MAATRQAREFPDEMIHAGTGNNSNLYAPGMTRKKKVLPRITNARLLIQSLNKTRGWKR